MARIGMKWHFDCNGTLHVKRFFRLVLVRHEKWAGRPKEYPFLPPCNANRNGNGWKRMERPRYRLNLQRAICAVSSLSLSPFRTHAYAELPL